MLSWKLARVEVKDNRRERKKDFAIRVRVMLRERQRSSGKIPLGGGGEAKEKAHAAGPFLKGNDKGEGLLEKLTEMKASVRTCVEKVDKLLDNV